MERELSPKSEGETTHLQRIAPPPTYRNIVKSGTTETMIRSCTYTKFASFSKKNMRYKEINYINVHE